MAKKMYRTMQGKPIDIERFIAQNEMTQAVGNMKVNARGDLLGPGGKVVKTRDQIMAEYNRNVADAVKDDLVLRPDPVVETQTPPAPEDHELALEDQEVENIKRSYRSKKDA
jgi:hypothetical protein